MKKIYLAGPSVFLPDAASVGTYKKNLCSKMGFEGLYPIDNEVDFTQPNPSGKIFEANIKMIQECDAIIADLTSFRGPSADVGTAWELGYAFGLGKVCVGYTNDSARLYNRTAAFHQCHLVEGVLKDPNEMLVENFGNFDNLMIDECLKMSGIPYQNVMENKLYNNPMMFYRDFTAFILCLNKLKEVFNDREAAQG